MVSGLMPGYISVIQQEYNKNVGDIMARINIPFIVKKQVIVQRPRIKIAAGGQHYFYATFDLCDVWDDIENKKAVFIRSGEPDPYPYVMDLSVGESYMECEIPWEVMAEVGYFDVGVFGGDRIPTSMARVFVIQGCICDGGAPREPTKDWFKDVDERLKALSSDNGGGSQNTSINWDSIKEKPFKLIGKTLKVNEGVLDVNTTDNVEQDNTQPITSAAVHMQIGNIGALLGAI